MLENAIAWSYGLVSPAHRTLLVRLAISVGGFSLPSCRNWLVLRPGTSMLPALLIFLEGEDNTGLYSVYAGWVKVVKFSLDGREQVLRYFGPGEVFNEVGSLLSAFSQRQPLACCQPLWRRGTGQLRRLHAGTSG